jgi:hypothetical protein
MFVLAPSKLHLPKHSSILSSRTYTKIDEKELGFRTTFHMENGKYVMYLYL